jgi:hypothetical protein
MKLDSYVKAITKMKYVYSKADPDTAVRLIVDAKLKYLRYLEKSQINSL